MDIPRAWVRASGEGTTREGQTLPVIAWGWGNDETTARREAESRLQRLLGMLRRGDPFPDHYAYASRPLREEILNVFESADDEEPLAMHTRNRYGCEVLNTARLLFLDIDVPPDSGWQKFLRGLGMGRPAPEAAVLESLRKALANYSRAAFRIYRTAAGYRVIAVDREFDPAGREAQELMQATGADPAFAHLCKVQKSFRARLTPKPWRCGLSRPPGTHPRDATAEQAFARWLADYERKTAEYATCQFLETVGNGRANTLNAGLIALHDRVCRADSNLPLA